MHTTTTLLLSLSSIALISAKPVDIESEVMRVNADMNLVPQGTQTQGTPSSAPTASPEPVPGAELPKPAHDFAPKDQIYDLWRYEQEI